MKKFITAQGLAHFWERCKAEIVLYANYWLGGEIAKIKQDVGDINDLQTTNKSSVIAAVNETLEAVITGKNIRGSWYYGARSVEDLGLIGPQGAGETAFVWDTEQLYTWSGAAWQVADPQPVWKVGDEFQIGSWFGLWNDSSYTGNATATILMTENGLALVVSGSTPVDEITIQTINGRRQIAPELLDKIDSALQPIDPEHFTGDTDAEFVERYCNFTSDVVQNGVVFCKNGDYLLYGADKHITGGKITCTQLNYDYPYQDTSAQFKAGVVIHIKG